METIKLLDIRIFYFINHALNNRYLDYLMALFTELGSSIFSYGLGLICLVFGKKEIKLLGIFLLAGIFISSGIISLLKPVFKVLRPCYVLENVHYFIKTYSYSFPSGHSCFAFTLATILGLRIKKRIFLYFLSTIVAFSRIYLGLHYLSDVMAGAAIGLIVGFSMVKLYNYFGFSNKSHTFLHRSNTPESNTLQKDTE